MNIITDARACYIKLKNDVKELCVSLLKEIESGGTITDDIPRNQFNLLWIRSMDIMNLSFKEDDNNERIIGYKYYLYDSKLTIKP